MQYEVEEYQTATGKKPFSEWLSGVSDKRAQAKLLARINRASLGNFGDWKALKDTRGLCEMREHYGPGFRIYYKIKPQNIRTFYDGTVQICHSEQREESAD